MNFEQAKPYVAGIIFALPVLASFSNTIIGNFIAGVWAWIFMSILIELYDEKKDAIRRAEAEIKRRKKDITILERRIKEINARVTSTPSQSSRES